MSDAIEILDANPEDAERYYEIQSACWIASYPNAGLGITKQDVEEVFKDRENRIAKWKQRLTELEEIGRGWEVKINGRVVGYCLVERAEPANKIRGMYIQPEFQDKGLGSQLIHLALSWLGDSRDITLGVAKYNDRAVEFYKRFGFEPRGDAFSATAGNLPNGKKIPTIEMIRPKKG